MGKKGKNKNGVESVLSENERAELSFFMDRLRMQDPRGPSLENCLKSLKQALSHREVLAAALLEALSREGGEVCFRAFCELQGIVRDKRLGKIVRRAGFRFRQKGFEFQEDGAPGPDSSPVILIKGESIKNECRLAVNSVHHFFQYAAYVYSPHSDAYATVVVNVGPVFTCHQLALLDLSRRGFRDLCRSGADFLKSPVHEIPLGHLARVLDDLAALGRIAPGESTDLGKVRNLLAPHRLEDPRPFFLQLWERKGRGIVPEAHEEALVEFLTAEPKVMPPDDGGLPRLSLLEGAVKELEAVKHGILEVPERIKRERERERLMELTRHLMSAEFCRALGRHWEEYALGALLNDDFSTAERVYGLAEHTRAVTDPGASRLMARFVELLMVIHHKFLTSDFEEALRKLYGDEPAEGDSEGPRTPSGLILPGRLIE